MSSRKSKRRQGHPARASRARSAPTNDPAKPKPQLRSRGLRPVGRIASTPARQAPSTFQERLGRLLTTLLVGDRRPRATSEAPGPAPARAWRKLAIRSESVIGSDLAWAAGTALISAVIFATALTSYPGLGDAPETIAGVSSLGILHAPGYPSYVLLAHAFTLLIPVGSEALKVNLFSFICGVLSIGSIQLLARRAGASHWAASVGALAVAVTAGVWFYSVFAKYDIFAGLLFVIALHLMLSWRERPATGTLVALAVVLALGLGASWPLGMLLFPACAFVLIAGRKGLSIRMLSSAVLAGAGVLVAVYGFVMLRAAQNPPLNWGDATTFSRLIHLIERKDFAGPTSQLFSAAPVHQLVGHAATIAPYALLANSARAKNYVLIFAHELGLAGVFLAALGVVISLTIRRTRASFPLLIAFAANALAASLRVAPGSASIDNTLSQAGFLLGCYFVLGCWIAVALSEFVALLFAGARDSSFLASPGSRTAALASVIAVLAGVTLVPPAVAHSSAARVETAPLADRYANSMFAELPPHAVLLVWGAELTQPLIYRQVVYHQRRDVTVIAADGLSYPWYRGEVARRLGVSLPPAVGNSIADAVSVERTLLRLRPVYLDPQAADVLNGAVFSQPLGLVSRAVSSRRQTAIGSPNTLGTAVLAAERTAGLPDPRWDRWPNEYVEQAIYSSAELRVARYFFQAHDLGDMENSLRNVLQIQPGNLAAEHDLSILTRSTGGG